jgi:sialidase-1
MFLLLPQLQPSRASVVWLTLIFLLHPASGSPSADCQQWLNTWCASPMHCPLQQHGECASGQGPMVAMRDVGGKPGQQAKAWRCYAANNTNAAHTKYTGGVCYCTRPELAQVLCKCLNSTSGQCAPKPLPPSPAPPPLLPLANSTYVVFNESFSPPGSRGPVNCYRIPAVVESADGTLVAMAEARIGKFSPDGKTLLHSSCSDCVVNGIAQRRSTDGGRHWGAYTWAVSDHSTDLSRPHMDIGGNPSLLLDRKNGKLILQFVRGLLDKKTQAQSCNPATTNWQQESTDSGKTWSKPVDISRFLGNWAGSLVGPSNGIQLRHARHANRLVWCGHWGVYNSTQVWYSDDGGATYTLSATVFDYMDECTLAELSDGRVYLNMRNNHRSACHCRGVATSTTGGASFSPLSYDAGLPSPVCQATLSTAGGALLFANPANNGSGFGTARTQGTIKKSLDNGLTWARQLSITPMGESALAGGSYDYSCLLPAPLHDDTSKGGLLWSHNTLRGWLMLFTRFPLDF